VSGASPFGWQRGSDLAPNITNQIQALKKEKGIMMRDNLEGLEWVGASRVLTGRPSRTFGRGRVCASRSCSTRLSCYNPTKSCSMHEGLH
jgi:hypothetical protein